MFSLVVHPGAEPWAPPQADLRKLRRLFGGVNGEVHLWPRAAVDHVTGRRTAPYAFRGFTRGNVSHLFVDSTETPQSIAWLMGHELCHHTVHDDSRLLSAFDRARPNRIDPASDRFHELDPHELYCDGIATNLLGVRLDRGWWRARTPQTDHSATSAMLAHRYGPGSIPSL